MPEFNDPRRLDSDHPLGFTSPAKPNAGEEPDRRLYVPNADGWQARVKQGWEKQYCYSKAPGEDFFHLILNGEIFLEHADEKLCLTCALRRGILTTDRLYWQRQRRKSNA